MSEIHKPEFISSSVGALTKALLKSGEQRQDNSCSNGVTCCHNYACANKQGTQVSLMKCIKFRYTILLTACLASSLLCNPSPMYSVHPHHTHMLTEEHMADAAHLTYTTWTDTISLTCYTCPTILSMLLMAVLTSGGLKSETPLARPCAETEALQRSRKPGNCYPPVPNHINKSLESLGQQFWIL